MYKPIFIAGPCVIETFDILEEVAKELVRLNNKYGINIIEEFYKLKYCSTVVYMVPRA